MTTFLGIFALLLVGLLVPGVWFGGMVVLDRIRVREAARQERLDSIRGLRR